MISSQTEQIIEENNRLKEILEKIKPFYCITGKGKDEDFQVVRRSILHTLELANDWIEKYNCPEEPKIMDWKHGAKFFEFNVRRMYNDLKDSRDMKKIIKDKIDWCDLELAGGNYGAKKYEYLQDTKSILLELLEK